MSTKKNVNKTNTGKMGIALVLALAFVLALSAVFDIHNDSGAQSVHATSTATTTVRVLNTPPDWVITARELVESSTSSPTNSDATVSWTARATDNNGERYRLLICRSSSTPNALVPECGGGSSDQWAISPWTESGQDAVASTTASESWSESNSWYGYICDENPGVPRCNDIMYNGLHEPGGPSGTSSPFVVNKRPSLTFASDDSPAFPGDVVTWTTTASDPDTLRNPLGDLLQLHVCRTPNFDPSVPGCVDGHWASSTSFVQSNPSASVTVPIPTQAGDNGAYVYVIDQFNHVSSGGWTGSSTVMTVGNIAPTIASSSIDLWGVFGSTTLNRNLVLTEPEGETQNFVVTMEVTDENGCLNLSSNNEIENVQINVYRSGVSGACSAGDFAAGNYNANNCYVHESVQFNPTCIQTASSCTANDWTGIEWECTFPLWYIADATDLGSQFPGDDWRVSARAIDSGNATSTYATEDKGANTGAQMYQFLSFRASGSPIAYGEWEVGAGTPNHPATTTLFATGNTGLHQYLSGDPMCPTYPFCTGASSTTIPVNQQRYNIAGSSLAFGDGIQLMASSSPALVSVGIPKPIATSTPTSANTYWGIFIPVDIALAGDYIGRNYIDAAISPSTSW
jgi:hypothetical protein